MTLADVLGKWFGMSGPGLLALFLRLKSAAPDAAATIDAIIVKLQQAATVENLLAFAGFILAEGGQIAQFKFKGEQHPSDLA
jgi:hypothetical protein